MSSTAIRVNDVSKLFKLGETRGYRTIRETLNNAVSALANRSPGHNGVRSAADDDRSNEEADPNDLLWALKGVSFDVAHGDVVGIIGRNGAGKSTLLKILSRITEPTSGEVELFGRVSSLLEVGTGFHPELTGRENVYLNGSILGMRKREIDRKFDEIVDFSGVERFLDTPVKRYSSGMSVRLAFAVAAHLEPEILIVDEVLAVGDAEFQRKCLGKMDDVARSGRTVIFVSHNMAAVENLCTSCFLLHKGKLEQQGATSKVVAQYLTDGALNSGSISFADGSEGTRIGNRVLRRFSLTTSVEVGGTVVPLGGNATFEVEGFSEEQLSNVTLNLTIVSSTGQRVAACHTGYQYTKSISAQGMFRLSCHLVNCRLMPGTYFLDIILKDHGALVDQAGPIVFEVVERDVYGTGKVLPPRTGSYVPEATWHFEQIPVNAD